MHEKYGPIVRVGPNEVSVADPTMIPIIYGTGSKFTKAPMYSTMSPIYQGTFMDTMFTTRDVDHHKALKSGVSQIFSMTNMKNFEVYVNECTRIFIETMTDLEGTTLDFSEWVQWYAFDVIGMITFQRRFGFMEERRDVDDMIGEIDMGLEWVKVLAQLPFLWTQLQNILRNEHLQRWGLVPDTLDKFLKITAEQVEIYDNSDNANTHSTRTDFLTQLRQKETKSGRLSQREMVTHLSTNLLAASDTTAIALSALFYYIVKTPAAYSKLQHEVDEADRSGMISEYITNEECLKMPYLQATIKEAMRLHPSVSYPLERFVPPEGAEVCGHALPAGTYVGVSAPVIHSNKELYGQDADNFRPERWLEDSPERLKTMDRYFFAFGHGARGCIGRNMAIMEMGNVVPQILRHFNVSWASPVPEWETHAGWFWKPSKLLVRLEKRQK